jgi:hypothetical protein
MELHRLLEKKKPVILKKWLAAIYDTYPADTAEFIKGDNDMFANPVGHTVTANAEYILEGLIRGEDTAALSAHVECIIRIRAVQDFTPIQAVSFMNSLKTVIFSQLKPEIHKHRLWDEWEKLEASVDNLTLMANEIYAKMKQRIQHIRMKEIEKSERFLVKLMGSRGA